MPIDIGTIPQWLTALGIGTFVVSLLRRDVQIRALQKTEDADVRKHLAEELERVVKRQQDCERREQTLRERVTELENDVLGLKRQIIRYSAGQVTLLEGNCPSPEISEAAERVRKITGEEG